MQASIFSCSTAFLAWEMLAVLLLAIPSFMMLLWRHTEAQWVRGGVGGGGGHIESMNITLNPEQQPPGGLMHWPPWISHSLPQPFIFFSSSNSKGPILCGDVFHSSRAPFYSEERVSERSSRTEVCLFICWCSCTITFFIFKFKVMIYSERLEEMATKQEHTHTHTSLELCVAHQGHSVLLRDTSADLCEGRGCGI